MAQDVHVSRRQVIVSNVLGLHLRAADEFVKLAITFKSEIQVHSKGITVNGRSILSLLGLAAECGSILTIDAHGCDAEDAVAALSKLISPQSHEPEAQHGEAKNWSPKTRPTRSPTRTSSSAESPGRSGSSLRWDSCRRGFKAGMGIDRRGSIRGRWSRRRSDTGV